MKLDNIFKNWESEYISREQFCKLTGGVIHRKTLRNLDSKGKGIPRKIRVSAKRVSYPVDSALIWLENRAAKWNNKNRWRRIMDRLLLEVLRKAGMPEPYDVVISNGFMRWGKDSECFAKEFEAGFCIGDFKSGKKFFSEGISDLQNRLREWYLSLWLCKIRLHK